MSKFTKALEKIQELKHDDAERSKRPATSFSIAAESEPPRRESWMQGVTEIKNTVPEHSIVTHHFSNSLISEQYRMLRVNLRTNLDKDKAQVVLVSSAIHGEGKTVTSANLAFALTENDDVKVCVVDADLRCGKLADYLGLGGKRLGLSEYLKDENGLSLRKVMYRNSRENLAIIPRGEHMNNPSGAIGTNKFRILIAELRNHFDYIIIDSPPIMAVADAGMLARDADGVLMVIQLGRTPKSIVGHSSMLFKQSGAKVLGYVLTNVEFHSSEYRYDYGYTYGYDETVPEGKGERIRKRLKLTEEHLEGLENKFTDWWQKKILKRK